MKLIRLSEFRNRDTVQVLKWLLGRATDGEIDGLALCFKDSEGLEQAAFTGVYKARPGDAVGAAMRLSWQLTKAQDEIIGPP